MSEEKSQNYLLDSNIISEVIKNNPSFNVIKKLTEHVGDCAMAVMTFHELLYGAERLDEGLRKTELLKFINEEVYEIFPIINYSDKSAVINAKIRAVCECNGKKIPYGDSQLAAIALSENMIMVTRNIKHFKTVAEFFPLKLENWFEEE